MSDSNCKKRQEFEIFASRWAAENIGIMPPISDLLSFYGSAITGPPGPEAEVRPKPWDRTLGIGWILYSFVRFTRPVVVFETGHGLSSMCIGMGLRDNAAEKVLPVKGHLTCVDPIPNIERGAINTSTEDQEEREKCHVSFHSVCDVLGVSPFITHICDFSEDYFPNWKTPINMMFVDGDHSLAWVDFENYFMKWATPGAFCFLHDTVSLPDNVGGVLQRIDKDYPNEYTVMHDPRYYGLGIIQKRLTVDIGGADRVHELWVTGKINDPFVADLVKPWNGKWVKNYGEKGE